MPFPVEVPSSERQPRTEYDATCSFGRRQGFLLPVEVAYRASVRCVFSHRGEHAFPTIENWASDLLTPSLAIYQVIYKQRATIQSDENHFHLMHESHHVTVLYQRPSPLIPHPIVVAGHPRAWPVSEI